MINQVNLAEFDISQRTSVSMQIEEMKTDDQSYIDTCLKWCELNDIDPSEISKYINDTLKQKLEAEAIKNNLLKGNKVNAKLKWLVV